MHFHYVHIQSEYTWKQVSSMIAEHLVDIKGQIKLRDIMYIVWSNPVQLFKDDNSSTFKHCWSHSASSHHCSYRKKYLTRCQNYWAGPIKLNSQSVNLLMIGWFVTFYTVWWHCRHFYPIRSYQTHVLIRCQHEKIYSRHEFMQNSTLNNLLTISKTCAIGAAFIRCLDSAW